MNRRFDSIPRADMGGKAAAVIAATLLLGAAASRFDSWALPQGERQNHNPFAPDSLAKAVEPKLTLRRDGSAVKAYEMLSARMLEAHLAANGYRIAQAKRGDAANSTAMLPRDLEFIQSKTYEELFPDLKSRQFIPISTEAPPGAQTITFRELQEYGEAALIANGAQDIPRVDVSRTESSVNVRTVAVAYAYSVQDLEAAAVAGVPLPMWKARAARRAYEQKIDALLFDGDSAAGLVGLNTLTGVLTSSPVTGAWVGTPATGDEASEDVATLMLESIADQGDISAVEFDNLILASSVMEWAKRTPVSATDNKDSILATIKKLNPELTISKWNRLETAGAASATRAFAYRKTEDVLKGHIPREFTPLAPQLEGMEWVVYNYGRIGGVESAYPIGIATMDGL